MQTANFKLFLAMSTLLPVVSSFAASEVDERLATVLPGPVYVAVQTTGVVQRLVGSGDHQTYSDLPNAHYIAVSDDGERVLVSDIGNGRAYIVETASGKKTGNIPVGEVAQGVKISPDGRIGLAIGAGPGLLTKIDMETGEVLEEMSVGANPHNIRFTADGGMAYVSLQGAGAIALVDVDRWEKVREIEVEGMATPHNIDLSDDERRLWIRDFEGSAAVLEIESGEVLARFDAGPSHGGIDVVPGGRYVATVAIGGSHVLLIDQRSLATVKSIDVGQGPHGVRASADGRWLYVGLTGDNQIAVIDLETLEVAHRLATDGEFPFWLAVPGNR
jgi:DNA-binding beta-propeller fold protein YncE